MALLKRYVRKIFSKSLFSHPTAKVGLASTVMAWLTTVGVQILLVVHFAVPMAPFGGTPIVAQIGNPGLVLFAERSDR